MKLYELTAGYQQVLEMVEEGNSDYLETLEALEGAIEDKAENTAKMIKSLDAQAEVIKAEEKRLADRRKSLENQAKRMKEYLQHNLEAAGLKKVKGSLLTVAIQKNAPSLNITDESSIDRSYFNTPEPVPVLDKKSLLQAIKDGVEVAGVELKQTESLRIR